MLNIVVGILGNIWIAYALWEAFRFSRRGGTLRRGLRIRTRAIDASLATRLRQAVSGEGQKAWGWYHREGNSLFVYVNPYYAGDGHLRLRFINHIAEVDLAPASPQITYRVPLAFGLLFSVFVLGLLPLAVWLHRLYVARIDQRLSELASVEPEG